jgi:hypothetical protein
MTLFLWIIFIFNQPKKNETILPPIDLHQHLFFCIGQEKIEALTVNIKDVNTNRWSPNISVKFFYNFFVN